MHLYFKFTEVEWKYNTFLLNNKGVKWSFLTTLDNKQNTYISSYNFSNQTVLNELNHIVFYAVMFLISPCLPSIIIFLQMQNRKLNWQLCKSYRMLMWDSVHVERLATCPTLSSHNSPQRESASVCANVRECKYI